MRNYLILIRHINNQKFMAAETIIDNNHFYIGYAYNEIVTVINNKGDYKITFPIIGKYEIAKIMFSYDNELIGILYVHQKKKVIVNS